MALPILDRIVLVELVLILYCSKYHCDGQAEVVDRNRRVSESRKRSTVSACRSFCVSICDGPHLQYCMNRWRSARGWLFVVRSLTAQAIQCWACSTDCPGQMSSSVQVGTTPINSATISGCMRLCANVKAPFASRSEDTAPRTHIQLQNVSNPRATQAIILNHSSTSRV